MKRRPSSCRQHDMDAGMSSPQPLKNDLLAQIKICNRQGNILPAFRLHHLPADIITGGKVIVVERCHDLLVGRQVADARLSTLDQLGGGQQRLLGQGQDLRLPLIGEIPPEQQLGLGYGNAILRK